MSKKEFIKKLRKNGYKATHQRIAIYEIINSFEEHPTAEDIHNEVLKKFPSLSLSTVYQVLHLLRDLGEVTELKLSNHSSKFETNSELHINLICPKCDTILDYYSDTMNTVWSEVENEFDFKPISQRIDVYRYCDACKETIK